MELSLLTFENKFLMITSDVSGPEEWPQKKETIDNSFKPPLRSVLKSVSLRSFKKSISALKIKINPIEKWSWKLFKN